MPSLPELQRDFAAGIFGGDADPVARHIKRSHFPAANLLQVYRNNVFSSLTTALQELYPVVLQLVGDGFFKYAANEYIKKYPSRSGNLHDFGEDLSTFLGEFPPASKLSYLPDVARLEWACNRAFHAADHDPLPLERLGSVPPEHYDRLRFKLHPAFTLIASKFPVYTIWEVNQPDYDGEETVDLDAGGEQALVSRPDLDVSVQRLGAGEFTLLEALALQRPFAEACTAALDAQADFDISSCLRTHALGNVLVDFEH